MAVRADANPSAHVARATLLSCSFMTRRLAWPWPRDEWTRRHSARASASAACLASLLLGADPVAAQASRADAIAEAQAAKAKVVAPYEPTTVEKLIDHAEDILLDPPMVYPWFGSILPGGLFAAGVGVHKPFSDSGRLAAHAGWSLRNYKTIAGRATLPSLARGRIEPTVEASWTDAPAVAVYALGATGSPDSRAEFGFKPRRVGGQLRGVFGRAEAGGGLELLHVATTAGRGDRAAASSFTQAALPGLGVSPTYLHGRVFAGFDWRDAPGYTRRGGAYRIELQDYRQHDDGPFSFRRLDAQVDQAVPILRANWVLAFHGEVATTYTRGHETVPFFLMPDLGGHLLRGFPAWRFRDRHRILVSGEYRWTPSQFVDMAVFYDAGKVTAARRDLNLSGLRRSYGIGIRFHAPAATVLRAELARTDEGFGLVLAFSPAF